MLNLLKRLALNFLKFANRDFCPGANQYTRWIKQPIGWVVGAIMFSILVGLFVGPQGYILASAFTALLILGLVWPWLSMRGIRCTATMPDGQLLENKAFEITFRVQNYWPIPVFGMMVKGDFLQELRPGEAPVVFSLRRIPALADTEFRIPITARRRGVFPSGEIEIVNGFPFGITEVARGVTVSRLTTVWPTCEALEGQLDSISGIQNIWGSLCDRSGIDGDTIGVRNWQIGDRLKNIHWAQYARSCRLMVRERQTLMSAPVLVILDLSPENHIGADVQNSYEWAIRLAASVCWKLHQNHSDIQIIVSGLDLPDSQRIDNRCGIDRLMDALASLPTMCAATPAATPARSSHIPVPGNGCVLLVGTNRSEHSGCASLKSILIDLEGLGWGDELSKQNSEGCKLQTQSSVLVTAPGLSAVDLKNDWSRSFSNATV